MYFKLKWYYYLDFKVQWHKETTDLVHDILCLCNCQHNGDRYLIIGVADNFFIKGIDLECKKRKNTAQINNLITQYFNKTPNIEVQTIDYEGKKLDCIIIKYDKNHIRPFYLKKQKKTNEKTISAGAIYSRNGNTNTSINETANEYEVEKMWREHFGIDKTAIERFLLYMKDIKNWEHYSPDIDSPYIENSGYYYKFFPEFHIKYKTPDT